MKRLSPEDLAEFVTQPTPRVVPRTYLAIAGAAGGCFLTAFGAIFLLVGSVLTFVFMPPRIVDSLRMGFGGIEQVTGTIDSCEETIFSVGNSSHSQSGTPVFRLDFSFPTTSGATQVGSSFVTGRPRKPGSTAQIEYLVGDLEVARVAGTNLNPLGLLPSFVLVFPTIGTLVLVICWRIRKRRGELLRDGSFAFAKITKIHDTKLTINRERVYEVTTLVDSDGPALEITTRVRGRNASLARERLASEERIGILYDPKRPKRALFTANLLESQ